MSIMPEMFSQMNVKIRLFTQRMSTLSGIYQTRLKTLKKGSNMYIRQLGYLSYKTQRTQTRPLPNLKLHNDLLFHININLGILLCVYTRIRIILIKPGGQNEDQFIGLPAFMMGILCPQATLAKHQRTCASMHLLLTTRSHALRHTRYVRRPRKMYTQFIDIRL